MKKMKTTLTILTILFMLLSLSGCGGLLNGEKQLTADKLVPTREEGSSSGVNTSDATLQLYGVYELTDVYGFSKLWITFSDFSSDWGYLLKLQDNGNNTYKWTNSSSNKLRFYLADADNGYVYFTSYTDLSQTDALMIVKESNSTYDMFDEISNLVTTDDVVYYNVKDDPYGINLSSSFTNYCYDCSSSYMTYASWYCDSYYRYLWVELDDLVWVCLGDVYSLL